MIGQTVTRNMRNFMFKKTPGLMRTNAFKTKAHINKKMVSEPTVPKKTTVPKNEHSYLDLQVSKEIQNLHLNLDVNHYHHGDITERALNSMKCLVLAMIIGFVGFYVYVSITQQPDDKSVQTHPHWSCVLQTMWTMFSSPFRKNILNNGTKKNPIFDAVSDIYKCIQAKVTEQKHGPIDP